MSSFVLEGARRAGYTPAEIAGFMGEQYGLDAAAARKSGWSDDDIIKELSSGKYKPRTVPDAAPPAAAPTAPPTVAADPAGLSPEWGGFDQPVQTNEMPSGGSVLDRPRRADLSFAEASRAQLQMDDRIAEARAQRQTGTMRATPPEASRDRWSERAGRAVMDATANPRLANLARAATDTYLLGPEAAATGLKLAADISNLGTLGLAQPVSDWLGETIKAVQAHKSDRFQAQQGAFHRLLADPNAGVLDVAAFMAANPRFSAEVAAPSVPSMLMGAAGARLGQALLKSSSGATVGAGAANTLMNAGATFSDTSGDVAQKLAAAGAAGVGTALLSRLGGAEVALAAGRAPGVRGMVGVPLREAGQEAGESLSQSIGQGTAEGNFDPAQAAKQATVEGIAGGLMGGVAGAVSTPYDRAREVGFHVEPPRTNDAPQVQRKKTDEVFVGVAAMYGLPAKIVQAARQAAEGRPLRDLGGFYSRYIAALQKRGAAPADIAPEALEALAHGAVPPPQPEQTEQGKAEPRDEAIWADDIVRPDDAATRIEATLRAAGALPGGQVRQQPAGAEAAPTAPGVMTDTSTAAPEIDAAAHEAATSPLNGRSEPTDAQKEAGNYKLGHARMSGFGVSIENPKGSVRRSKADAPQPWEITMPAHYGYLKGTKAADGDHVDLFIGDAGDNGRFWVINQTTPDGKKFDEHKVVTGVDSANAAVALYKASFADGFGDRVFSSITDEMDAAALREVLPRLERQQPLPDAAAQRAQREALAEVDDLAVRASDEQAAAAAARLGIEARSANSRRSMLKAQAQSDAVGVRDALIEAMKAAPRANRDALQESVVTLRKRQSVLRSLLECMAS